MYGSNLLFFLSHSIQNPSSQSLPKTITSFPKSRSNRCQNGSKSRSGEGSGEFLGGSGAALGCHLAPRPLWAASWMPLGQLLGGSGSVLGASWVGSWAVLGIKLGRLGGLLEASCSDFFAPSHSSSSAFYFDRILDRTCLIWGPFPECREATKR